MANEVEQLKPRGVKPAPEVFDAEKAASYSAADGRRLRRGHAVQRKLADASAVLDQALLNLRNEMTEREAELRLQHASYIARLVRDGEDG